MGRQRMTSLESALRDIGEDRMLACWCGIIFDNEHRHVRSDRIRLVTACMRRSRPILRNIPGYRAAAIATDRPMQGDYRLVFDASLDIVVIRGTSARRGRHALESDLTGDECCSRAGGVWRLSSTGDSRPRWVSNTLEAFDTFVCAGNDIMRAESMPVPDLKLISPRGSSVFRFDGIDVDDVDGVEQCDGKVVRRASQYYGQGVLAAEPGYPMGYWHSLPMSTSRIERNDIVVALQPTERT